MTKEIVTAALKGMPREFELDEFIERLIVIEKIEEGLKDIEEGRTISHSEIKEIIEEWKK